MDFAGYGSIWAKELHQSHFIGSSYIRRITEQRMKQFKKNFGQFFEPISRNYDYQLLAKKIITVEELPQGALVKHKGEVDGTDTRRKS